MRFQGRKTQRARRSRSFLFFSILAIRIARLLTRTRTEQRQFLLPFLFFFCCATSSSSVFAVKAGDRAVKKKKRPAEAAPSAAGGNRNETQKLAQ